MTADLGHCRGTSGEAVGVWLAAAVVVMTWCCVCVGPEKRKMEVPLGLCVYMRTSTTSCVQTALFFE